MSSTAQRNKRIVNEFMSGMTGTEIAEKYGISRQRVKQILDSLGVSARQGGIKEKARKKAKRRQKMINDRCMRINGMPLKEFRKLCPYGTAASEDSLKKKYNENRNAKRKTYPDAEWRFTFKTWVNMWKRSGKLNKRGKGADQYVLFRKGNTGPFSPKNCVIIKFKDAVSIAQRLSWGSQE